MIRTPPRVMPAMVTAFADDGEIDLAAHRYNAARLWDRGLRGLVIAGSTGEGPYLEPGERTTLCAAARDEVGTDLFVVCGIAAETLRMALTQVEEAASAGADTVLVMTPTTLVRGRHDLVTGFYADVADRSPMPVLLYTVPSVTGYELPVESVVTLAGHDNVIGIKDSGGNPERMEEWRDQVPDGFFSFCGASRAITRSMKAGAHGAITASANYASGLVARCVQGDEGAQQELITEIDPVEQLGVPGTKAAAGRSGLRPGPPRRPLRSVPVQATAGPGGGS